MHTKALTYIHFVFLLGVAGVANAAEMPSIEPGSAEAGALRSDVSANFSYTAPSKLENGRNYGDLDTLHYRVGYGANVRMNEDWSWQTGVDYQQLSFSVPDGAPLPNTLRSVGVPLGFNWRINEKWGLRFQVHPGVYSDFKDISGDDVFVPVFAAATFKINTNLQVLGGLAVEYRRDIPVIPFAGVRWKFAEDWTLSLMFPRSGVEYAYSKELAFFGGLGVLGGAYQVSEHFGDKFGHPELNNDSLTYWEIRVGAGARYRVLQNLSLEVDGGWAALRRFTFRDSDFTLKTEGAPYVQTSLRVSF